MAEEIGDPSIEAENPEPESQRPGWLPEKFADEEAFAKSYKELERAFHETRTELKSQQERFEEFLMDQQTQQQQAQQQQQVDQFAAAYADAMESGDYQRAWQIQQAREDARAQALLQAVQQQNTGPSLPADVVADLADTKLAAQYQDWGTYRDQAAAWLGENQFLINDEALGNPNVLAQRLDVAYKAVKGAALAANPQLAQTDLTQQKLAAQTMTGAGVRQPAASSQEEWAKAISEANKNLGGFSTL